MSDTKGEIIETNDNSDESEDRVQFKRQITLIPAIAIVVGIIIGSGIFVSPKGVYEYSNCSITISLVIWGLCGLFSMLGSLCYAEIGTTITRSGGDYAYIYEGFGSLLAYLYLWVSILMIRPTTQTIMALTFANYILGPLFDTGCDPPQNAIKAFAALALCFLTYINCSNVKWALKVQNIFTISKLLALIIIIVTGFYFLIQGDYKNITSTSLDPKSHKTCHQSYSSAFYSGLFAFGGWNFLNFVTEELKNPYKNLPRAALIGIFISTLVYVLTNISYFVILTPTEVLYSPAIAMVFAKKVLGVIAPLMPIAVALSTFGSVNGIIFTSARLFCVGAQQKHLPSIFGMIHINRSTPTPSLIISCILSLLMLVTSDIYQLINYFSFTNWFVTGVAVAAGIRLRFTRPELYRPIKLPLILSIIFTLSCVGLTAMAVISEPINAVIGGSIVIAGIPFYYLQNTCNNKLNKFNSIRSSLQKLLQVVAIEEEQQL
ncbi:Y+L amino acid transporter 2-like [Oppia nitens]|uniref:Y+L amino acid transporter 2-like n=1 Tax=Oppia nitens TaxID=1686743 RepID=UPI0023DBCBA1|nr:Y+L amino acid transporter 2-like [Oppia nitens]